MKMAELLFLKMHPIVLNSAHTDQTYASEFIKEGEATHFSVSSS